MVAVILLTSTSKSNHMFLVAFMFSGWLGELYDSQGAKRNAHGKGGRGEGSCREFSLLKYSNLIFMRRNLVNLALGQYWPIFSQHKKEEIPTNHGHFNWILNTHMNDKLELQTIL